MAGRISTPDHMSSAQRTPQLSVPDGAAPTSVMAPATDGEWSAESDHTDGLGNGFAPGASGAPATEQSRALAMLRGLLRHTVHVLWPCVLLVGAWQLWVSAKNLPPAVAPQPRDVLSYLSANPGSLVSDALNTLLTVVGGVALGAVVGLILAGLCWFVPIARALISAPTLLTQCVPIAVLVPVLARILGYNQRTVVIIAAIIGFFPVLVLTSAGLALTPFGSGDFFAVSGSSRWQRFRHLAVPSAVPRLLVALRMSVVAAFVGAMLAQWIMGANGLGYRLVVAQAAFRTDEAWAVSCVSIVLSVLLYSAVSALCRLADSRFT